MMIECQFLGVTVISVSKNGFLGCLGCFFFYKVARFANFIAKKEM